MRFLKIVSIIITIMLNSNSIASECVILIHGFGRKSFSMGKINSHLYEQGYQTISIDYPSRHYPLIELIEKYIMPKIEEAKNKCDKIHFVGYSMGGIITRYVIANNRPENLGRVVMIATPNKGCEVIDILRDYQWFETIFGPAVSDISTDALFLKKLPSYVDYDVGVISGNFSINPITSIFMLPGENDGTVTLESTKIEGMKDHLIIPSSHSMILNDQHVIEQVGNFISKGNFTK